MIHCLRRSYAKWKIKTYFFLVICTKKSKYIAKQKASINLTKKRKELILALTRKVLRCSLAASYSVTLFQGSVGGIWQFNETRTGSIESLKWLLWAPPQHILKPDLEPCDHMGRSPLTLLDALGYKQFLQESQSRLELSFCWLTLSYTIQSDLCHVLINVLGPKLLGLRFSMLFVWQA